MSYTPYSAISENIHDIRWFGNFNEDSLHNNTSIITYSKLPVTTENFEKEKLRKIYLFGGLRGSDIPEDCSVIKFSYYSEHQEPILIEEENIAIVSNGVDSVSVITSRQSYQFTCDENGIPFADTCDVKITVRQGSTRLKILKVSISSDETSFKDGIYSSKIQNTEGVTIEGTENNFINGISATVLLSIARTEKHAKDRIGVTISVTYEKYNGEAETQDVYFVATAVATGVYLGMMTDIKIVDNYFSLIDSNNKTWITGTDGRNINKGDYMLWGGKSVQIGTGELIQGLLYTWNGIGWERDTNENHTFNTFSDVISIAEKLEENSDTVKVFKSLTTALLNVGKIFANNITLMERGGKKGIIKSANWETKTGYDAKGVLNNDQTIKKYSDSGWALDYDGKADFVNMHTTNMQADGGTFDNITANGGTFNNITANGGTFNNITANGGTFNNITAEKGTFNDVTIQGKLVASKGFFLMNKVTSLDFNNFSKDLSRTPCVCSGFIEAGVYGGVDTNNGTSVNKTFYFSFLCMKLYFNDTANCFVISGIIASNSNNSSEAGVSNGPATVCIFEKESLINDKSIVINNAFSCEIYY